MKKVFELSYIHRINFGERDAILLLKDSTNYKSEKNTKYNS